MPKVNVKRAAASKTAMNLDSTHVTTFEFGQTRPILYRHMNPSEKIDVDLAMMVRSSALTYPSYGGIRFIHRGFFVPYRLISPKFEDFFRGRTINHNGVASDVAIPTFTNFDVVRLLTAANILPSGISLPVDDLDPRVVYSQPDISKPLGFSVPSSSALLNSYPNLIDGSLLDPSEAVTVQNGFLFAHVQQWNKIGINWVPPVVPLDSNSNPLDYDFYYDLCINPDQDSDNQNQTYVRVFCRMKPYGRFVIKVFNSLGYKITFPTLSAQRFIIYDPTNFDSTKVDKLNFETDYEEEYNAFALLAYLRIIYDNYLPSQFAQNSIFNAFFMYLTMPDVFTNVNNMKLGSTSNIPAFMNNARSPLAFILSDMLYYGFQVFAGSDYFTDAWYNENSVISGQFVDYSNSNPGSVSLSSTISRNNYVPGRGSTSNPIVGDTGVFFTTRNSADPNNASTNNLLLTASASGHKWLNSLYNLFLRSNLAGSRIGETLLSVFGIKAPSAKLDKSVYLGKKMNDFVIGDVTSFATTENAQGEQLGVLGEYAGKGYSFVEHDHGNKFSYEADEWGVFLILSSTIADGGYVQGIDRMNLITDRFDFYQPELEKTGMQPTLVEEFMAPPSQQYSWSSENYPKANNNYRSGNCFGFLPRYSFMKKPCNLLTGDFEWPSLGGGIFGELNAYHTFRLFSNPNFSIQNASTDWNYQKVSSLVQPFTNPVAQGEVLFDNGTQYNRIFSVQDNQQDHFFAVISFKTKLITPMIGMANSIDLDGFNEIEMQMNGTAMD